MTTPTTPIPARLSLTVADTKHLGTILYRGPIPSTKGEWYGVEWDEPSRGRHDGVHDATGVRYFTCRVKGAGTFLRLTAPGLSLGTSFPVALRAKYSPTPAPSAAPNAANPEGAAASTFYETASNFAIEVTSLAKIEDTFRNLGRLREAGLEWEGVSCAGEEEERRSVVEKLVRLEILNLSFSLIPSFQVASEIVEGLPKLRVLALNSNRFEILHAPTRLEAFSGITELQLNQTLVSWAEIVLLSPSLPSLVVLQLGANRLATLNPPSTPTPPDQPFPHLEVLNLAENELDRWDEILTSLSQLPRLSRLILTSNKLATLLPLSASSPSPPPSFIHPVPPTSLPTLRTLRHLSLSHNLLTSWSDLDALNDRTTFPLLSSLSVEGFSFGAPEDELRLLVIARVGSLAELDGSKITEVGREDAELYYLSSIAKESSAGTAEEEELERRHPRWRELLERYEQKPATQLDAPPKRDTIRSKLIHLTITFPTHSPPLAPLSLSLLPTLPTRVLRTQIAKALGWRTLPKDKWRLWAVLRPYSEGEREGREEEEEDGPVVEIVPGEEGREVSWWGLGEGDEVRVLAMEMNARRCNCSNDPWETWRGRPGRPRPSSSPTNLVFSHWPTPSSLPHPKFSSLESIERRNDQHGSTDPPTLLDPALPLLPPSKPITIPISASELASLMGVDDPNRKFKGTPQVNQGDPRSQRLGVILHEASPEELKPAMVELAQNHLPAILRSQVECDPDLGDQAYTLWRAVAGFCHDTPAYARFVRDHPYAPTYYDWLIKDSAQNLASWADLRDGIEYSADGFSATPVPYASQSYAIAFFGSIIDALHLTIITSASAPSPDDFIFPPFLLSAQSTIVDKLTLLFADWRRAGAPLLPADSRGWFLAVFSWTWASSTSSQRRIRSLRRCRRARLRTGRAATSS